MKLPNYKRLPSLRPFPEGKKLNELTLDLNASQTLTLVVHGITLLEPLLTDHGKVHPAWLS